MKVAILSMQEVKNYGSFLQAFSLKKTIESLGNTCEFINIIPGEQLGNYKISKFIRLNSSYSVYGGGILLDVCLLFIFSKLVFRKNFCLIWEWNLKEILGIMT